MDIKDIIASIKQEEIVETEGQVQEMQITDVAALNPMNMIAFDA